MSKRSYNSGDVSMVTNQQEQQINSMHTKKAKIMENSCEAGELENVVKEITLDDYNKLLEMMTLMRNDFIEILHGIRELKKETNELKSSMKNKSLEDNKWEYYIS